MKSYIMFMTLMNYVVLNCTSESSSFLATAYIQTH